MKTKYFKFILCFTVLALCACAVFFACAFKICLPRGTYVDGVDVGGLTKAGAVIAVRERKEEDLRQKELRICAGECVYTYRFPEFYYTDDLGEVVRSIRRKGEYFSEGRIYLNGAEEIVGAICADVQRAVVEPYARFNRSGEPFDYFEGCDGVVCDGKKLLGDIDASLNGSFDNVTAVLSPILRGKTLEDVKRGTVKICAFSTYFDGSNYPRSSNIRLAVSKINGSVLYPGQTFSFNEVVGPRSLAAGFLKAKIISGGEFVDGVGGGVCQVSTTLYNAALLSGLDICEYHPHSLSVGYVSPSRDAMVSGNYYDLKIRNGTETPVYIRMKADYSSLTCTVYGTDDGCEYSVISKVTGSLPRPEERIVEGDEEKIVTHGRDGTVSESYLQIERDGVTTRRLLRRDKYAAVGGVRQIKREETEQIDRP